MKQRHRKHFIWSGLVWRYKAWKLFPDYFFWFEQHDKSNILNCYRGDGGVWKSPKDVRSYFSNMLMKLEE